MADGDMVIQITTRGNGPIWNMFRVDKDGFLTEHWTTGSLPSGGAGGPPGGAGAPGAGGAGGGAAPRAQ
jgi:hypothetical protein